MILLIEQAGMATRELFMNPDHIVSVKESGVDGACIVVDVAGMKHVVNHTPRDVLTLIERREI